MDLILASASPRRKELLEQLGYRFQVLPVDIDETPLAGEVPADYLPRMSTFKATAAAEKLCELSVDKDTLILASDTSVIVGQKILGKPNDQADFMAMMRQLSGNWHEVMTSIALLRLPLNFTDEPNKLSQITKEKTVITRVKFARLSEIEIEAYWQTGEPKDKAGGYGIQGKGAIFVEAIEGSYSSVVGLPLHETANLLKQEGLDISDIWQRAPDR